MLNKIILVVDFKSWERLPCVIESVTSLIPPTADKTITCKVKCQIYNKRLKDKTHFLCQQKLIIKKKVECIFNHMRYLLKLVISNFQW